MVQSIKAGREMLSIEEKAIERAREELKRLLGDNLVALVAFGSRVRGDFTGDSDFDILVVVKQRSFKTIGTINSVFAKEEDRTFTPFSVVVKTLDSFEKERAHNTTFYRNIKREGVAFYGRA